MSHAIERDDDDDDDERRDFPELSDPRVPQIIHHCIEGKDYTEIAVILGIDPRTLWNLRRKYGIDRLLEQYIDEALLAARSGYVRATQKAFQRLLEMLDSKDSNDRKFAIARLLDLATKRGDDPAPKLGARAARRLSSAELAERARELAQKRKR